MTIYQIDPLSDPRWVELVNRHPRASVFHTAEWLKAIHLTYGYHPVVLTTSGPAEELSDGVVFCQIQSWLTGRRMVSIPFSDHCEPLVSSRESIEKIMGTLRDRCRDKDCEYIEMRPLNSTVYCDGVLPSWEQYYFHTIDLHPELDAIFSQFQKSSVQRKIQKAEREELVYEEGRSASLLERFYNLLLLTRRKHQLPPQPREWFRNIMDCMGERMKIRVVSKGNRPIASILTLTFKHTITYKYGGSVPEINNLGGTPYLFWRAIQEAKELGMTEFDLGRSQMDNQGLVTFKERLGGQPSILTYLRYPEKVARTRPSFQMRMAKQLFSRMPNNVQTATGRLLYRHIG